jgi:hypothetical protein
MPDYTRMPDQLLIMKNKSLKNKLKKYISDDIPPIEQIIQCITPKALSDLPPARGNPSEFPCIIKMLNDRFELLAEKVVTLHWDEIAPHIKKYSKQQKFLVCCLLNCSKLVYHYIIEMQTVLYMMWSLSSNAIDAICYSEFDVIGN